MLRRLSAGAALLAIVLLAPACGDSPTERGASCTPDLSLRATAGYTGPLFDAHMHFDEGVSGALVRCRGAEQDVAGALVFARMDPTSPAATERTLRSEAAGPAFFVPFFHVDPKQPADMDSARLAKVIAGRTGLFVGIGEVGLYRDPWRGTSLQAAPWPGVFAFAEAHDLWLMIHAGYEQHAEVPAVLRDHPGTRFYMHGSEPGVPILEWVKNHPNLYISVDAIALTIPPGSQAAGGLMGTSSGAADFIARFDAQRDAILDAAVARWLPVIAAAPDRVTWGTDAFQSWHFDPRVYQRLIDLSRRFIERLPAEYREPYAYGNARRLFGAPGEI